MMRVCVCSINAPVHLQDSEIRDSIMFFFHSSRVLLIMCVWGICPLTTDQFPVPGGFNLLLYPVSVPGPLGPHTLLIPVTTAERNTQNTHTPQANRSKITSQSLSKPSNANSAFLQPEPGREHAPNPAPNAERGPAPNTDRNPVPNAERGPAPNIDQNPAPNPGTNPAPDLHTLPSESPALQGQMQPNFVPLQVYSLFQQAVISDSGSSEEGDAAQVVFLLPVRVDSPSMGVMEASAPVPDPDPGHLQVPVATSPTAHTHTHGETAAHTHTLGNKKRL
ncbi:uncharacterized protein LOC143749349 [Siphateles boraxobius]|uniref:uncharacterized protein LOC143749349 n=1 Tax=Siphateles boraxobius TaxID=180520 RepID=UPI00406440D9